MNIVKKKIEWLLRQGVWGLKEGNKKKAVGGTPGIKENEWCILWEWLG